MTAVRFIARTCVAFATVACGSDSPSEPQPSGDAGTPGTIDVFGDLGGRPFEARSSNAMFNEVPDRAYVSISINGWEETCDMDAVCDREQLNFTLYAIGGTRDDIRPGTYDVGSTVDVNVTYEVVGAAGRYDGACTTGGGFATFESGSLTITAVAGGRVQGDVEFTVQGGATLRGPFDAVECTP